MLTRKTLLQINVTANWGSTGKIAEGIGQVALKQGWNSVIAYGRGNPTSSSELIRIGSDWDMKMHAISSRLFDNHGLMSVQATKRFISQINDIKPNIIHLHNIHGYYLNYPMLFKYLKNADIPIVWTLHDCWSFTGHCAYFDYVKCKRWKSGCYNCPQKQSYPQSILLDRSKRNFNLKKDCFENVDDLHLIPVSEWLKQLLAQSFLSEYDTRVVHNGIDTDNFNISSNDELKNKYQNKRIILGVASIWEKRKGLQDFIALSRYMSNDYLIVLIGINETQQKNLPHNIIGITRTESQQVLRDMYSCAEVFFNPTYEDNFPTTNLEALACGTPVITYRTGGSPEAITEDTGFVVNQGDLKAVIDAIEIIRQKGKNHYSEKCRERAVKHFRKEDRFMDYMNLYDSILEHKTM